jgi:(R,R)-butanediol dehydrogenase / meso-butanediol dehydrogenase / diacetyl reductase
MRAACYYGLGDVRIEQLREPSPRPGEVKVRVLANGLRGTDLHQYSVGPMSDASLPIVVGHEFAGGIVEAGEGVRKSRIGQLVAIEPIGRCNSCAQLKDGDYNLCQHGCWHGLTGKGEGQPTSRWSGMRWPGVGLPTSEVAEAVLQATREYD